MARREAVCKTQTSVRPRVANVESTVEAQQGQEDIVWWRPRERGEDEEMSAEEEEEHPARWWRHLSEEENETEDNGLGQDGLRIKARRDSENQEIGEDKDLTKDDEHIGENKKFAKEKKNKVEKEKSAEDDWRKAKGKKKIYEPSKEEIINHEKTHCPFRAWCKHCVRGRASNAQHRQQPEDL